MSQFNAISYDIERNTGVCAFTGEKLTPGDMYVATLVDLNAAEAAGDMADVPGVDEADLEAKAADAQAKSDAVKTTGSAEAKGEADSSDKSEADKAAQKKRNELGFKRVDVSIEAWDQGHRPPHLFSFWKSVVPEPNAKKKMFIDDGVLVDMFRRLGDKGQEERAAFRFVLGLILMRKKKLRYEGVESAPDDEGNEQEHWLMMPIPKGDVEEPWRMLNPHLEEDEIQKVAEELNEIMNGEMGEE